jgi:multidrug efflux pump
MGGRASNAQYQYTLQSSSLADLREWAPKLAEALKANKTITDVNSDQQDSGHETFVQVDRDTAARMGVDMVQVASTLYDAFGQRQVSVIYNDLNQYRVILEASRALTEDPRGLEAIHIGVTDSAAATTNAATNAITASGRTAASSGAAVSMSAAAMVPLSGIATFRTQSTPLSVNHQGLFAATTVSFNLGEGKALSDATAAIEKARQSIGMPASVRGGFQGTAKVFAESMRNQPILVLGALLAVYIVLGMLYESLIHPITILSTLPSAGVGALIALRLAGADLDIMGMIGIILLIGIVKKNAIIMIDFAVDAERTQNLSPREAIYRACLLRFRPIMMTTAAALLGALPLAFGFGEGSELRRPLGLAIVGGLLFSQLMTLFTTPVIYLYFDRFSLWCKRKRA